MRGGPPLNRRFSDDSVKHGVICLAKHCGNLLFKLPHLFWSTPSPSEPSGEQSRVEHRQGAGVAWGWCPPQPAQSGQNLRPGKSSWAGAWWGSSVGYLGVGGQGSGLSPAHCTSRRAPYPNNQGCICSRTIPARQHRLFRPHANIQKLPCAFSKDRMEQHGTSQSGFVYTFVDENGKSQDTSLL